jgi:hypothetical protein
VERERNGEILTAGEDLVNDGIGMRRIEPVNVGFGLQGLGFQIRAVHFVRGVEVNF